VKRIDDSVYALAGGAGSRRGTGGMRTKLQAAELATSQGIDTVITNGKHPEALYEVVASCSKPTGRSASAWEWCSTTPGR
jgi:glutamate 5-kinase